ncbi:MAG: CBS domain-containing protein [Candidatus Dadabacteria bacterium]|nr:CBS domain-containing protein [Candidatus Dadabacteria bacterium]NIQ13691.1 CBS domain-containing protein [Candidatus Dadabacteria bacterium]
MESVINILKKKGNNVWTISPNKTVYQALEMLADKDIGALLVVSNGKVVGIFSERDYARKVILKGKSSINTTVGELMVKDVYYVSPSDSIDECMTIITEKRVRHLPVVENDELIGLISIGDIVNHVISLQKFKIEELKKYISGGY